MTASASTSVASGAGGAALAAPRAGDGVHVRGALEEHEGVRGAARRQWFRLRKIELSLLLKTRVFRTPLSAVIIRIAIIFPREIDRRGHIRAQTFAINALDHSLGSAAAAQNTDRIDAWKAAGLIY